MTKDATPTRSIRLTKAHREDMVAAVIKEWESQNPPPERESREAYFKAIANQIKKSPAFKRTEKILAAGLDSDDLKHVSKEAEVRVAIVDADGATRDMKSVVFPASVAKRLGVLIDEFTIPKGTGTYAPSELERSDIHGEKPNSMEDENRKGMSIVCAAFVDRTFPQVRLNVDDPVLEQRRVAAKARDKWREERNRLRIETRDVLEQFNTTKQLREAWPDIVPYLPPHLADPERAVRLPVLATSRLSERLGIKGESDNG